MPQNTRCTEYLTSCCFFETMSWTRNIALGTMLHSIRQSGRSTLTLLSVSVACAIAGPVSAQSEVMDAWRDYARASITPDFSWADKPALEAPSVMGRVLGSQTPVVRLELGTADSSVPLSLSFSSTLASDSPHSNSSFGALSDADLPRAGLVQDVLAAGVSRAVSDSTRLTAAVLIANQQFASFGLGTELIEQRINAPQDVSESSSGVGVRVGFEQLLNDQLSVATSMQSRIDMESFQSYRGVHSGPGDFDLPARASVVARWTPLPFADVSFSVQRVFYSDLVAFHSASLPVRVLSLLNDGSTPAFTWRDLDIYGADIGFQLGAADRLTLRYSSQQQPQLTSLVLSNAFGNTYTDQNFAVGYEHSFERAGRLRFAASYAPSEYFLGNVSGLDSSDPGRSMVEAEAIWRFDF